MSSKQRLALIVGALVVAVVAFVVLNASDDDDGKSDDKKAVATAPADNAPNRQATTTEQPAGPTVERIAIAGGRVDGGVRTITVKKGDQVRIVITSDAPDELHLHGYDIEKEAEPGKPARFDVTADLEGVFELESHTAEDQGLPPAVAKLVVEPS
jgi:FtsP/CotA-like multicopper oxidase with cupredoxin domain